MARCDLFSTRMAVFDPGWRGGLWPVLAVVVVLLLGLRASRDVWVFALDGRAV